jgi:hypothetical protein
MEIRDARRRKRWLLAPMLVLAVTGTADAAQVLTAEPRPGALREGQRVLVDDGTCPTGQIKEVMGRSTVNTSGQVQSGRIQRTRCIPHK